MNVPVPPGIAVAGVSDPDRWAGVGNARTVNALLPADATANEGHAVAAEGKIARKRGEGARAAGDGSGRVSDLDRRAVNGNARAIDALLTARCLLPNERDARRR